MAITAFAIGVFSALAAAACFALRARLRSLRPLAPAIHRISVDPDGVSLDLVAGARSAQIHWILVRSGAWLRPVRVKRLEARNWEGAEVREHSADWKLRLRDFRVQGKYGLPEGMIRIGLEQPPESVRIILLGNVDGGGEKGFWTFALQRKIAVSDRGQPSQITSLRSLRSTRVLRLRRRGGLRPAAAPRSAEQQIGG